MWHRALWRLNFRKGGWLVAFLAGSMWLFTTGPAMRNMRDFTPEQLIFRDSEWGWTGLNPSIAGMFIVAFLSIALFSDRKRLEYLFSFPFKRSDIFWSRWLFGAVSIFLATLVNSVAISISFFRSPLSDFVPFHPFLQYFGFNFLFLLAVFSFGLMIGVVAKGIVSHFFLGAVGMVWANGVGFMILEIISIHYRWFTRGNFWVNHTAFSLYFPRFFQHFSLLSSLGYVLQLRFRGVVEIEFQSRNLWTLIGYLAFSLIVGHLIFIKDYNLRKFEPFVRWGSIIGVSLLLGTIFDPVPLVFYTVSPITGIVLYFITRQFRKEARAS